MWGALFTHGLHKLCRQFLINKEWKGSQNVRNIYYSFRKIYHRRNKKSCVVLIGLGASSSGILYFYSRPENEQRILRVAFGGIWRFFRYLS